MEALGQSKCVSVSRRRALGVAGVAVLTVGVGAYLVVATRGADDSLNDSFLPLIVLCTFLQVVGLNALFWWRQLVHQSASQTGYSPSRTTFWIVAFIAASPIAVVLLALVEYTLTAFWP